MKPTWRGALVILPWLLCACNDDKVTTGSNDVIAPDPITNLTVAGAHSFSLSVLWTATGDDGNTGLAEKYDLRFATHPITDENWDECATVEGEPRPSEPGVSDYVAVTGLEPATSYYFAIKVCDEAPNWSGLSNVSMGTTAPPEDTTGPSRVIDLRVTQTEALAVMLAWTAPGDDQAEGQAATYDLRYSVFPIHFDADFAAAAMVTGLPAPGPSGTNEQFTIRGLVPNTEYYFSLKTADDVSNWSIISNTAQTRTLVAESVAPDAILDLRTGEIGFNAVELEWTASGDDGKAGTAGVYDLRFYTSNFTESMWPLVFRVAGEPVPQAGGEGERFVLAGLQPSTHYWIAMKVGDEVPNWSSLSNVVSLSTIEAPDVTPPNRIVDLAVDSTSRSTIFLHWPAPGDDGAVGLASGYELRYSTIPFDESTWSSAQVVAGVPSPHAPGTIERFAIGDLKVNTTYYIAIKTVDDAGNWSVISNLASGTTHN